LEILRQPLEDQHIMISRSKNTLTFPASFMLVAAMNPCPCGNLGNRQKECICNPYQIQKYRNKISGPLLDRIDIHIDVPALKVSELTQSPQKIESSQSIRQRVVEARAIQTERFKASKIHANAQMSERDVRNFCLLDDKAQQTLNLAIEKLKLSARAYDRILKVSRTIADLDKSGQIKSEHIAEAARYRDLDR
jgi:magnesium chelatase family protein